MGVIMFFSSFDRIFCLTGFVFDIDDFHFSANGKIGDAFPQAVLELWQQIQSIGR